MPFFRTLLPTPGDIVAIHRLFVEVINEYDAIAARGDRIARRQSALAASAYADFMADLEKVAARTADLANQAIPGLYDSSRVGRPQTPGPLHLRDALPTSGVVATGLPSGTVGIVDLEELDKFEYWKAQEFGSDHMVGREIRGFFSVPGTAAPDPSQFRSHALFTPASRGRTAHFQNPIPEGRFIRDGLEAVEAYWSKEMFSAGEDAIKDLRATRGLRRGRALTRRSRERQYQRLQSYKTPQGLANALRRL